MTCGTPSAWHVSRAAITASGEQHARSASGPKGSSHRRSVTPTAFGNARRSATALSTPPLIATAVRPARGSARKIGPRAFASASAASVSPGTAAASSSVRPVSGRVRPSASASTIRSPSTRSLTAAHSPSRVASPNVSTIRTRVREREPRLPFPCSTLPVSRTYVNLANQVGAAPVFGTALTGSTAPSM